MRARIFWKIGLTYLALLVGVLLAVDFYSAEVLRREYIRKTNEELTSLLNLARTRPPAINNLSQLRSWVDWMSQSGARVTVIENGGKVLADSAQDLESLGERSTSPEVQQAFANGQGHSLSAQHGLRGPDGLSSDTLRASRWSAGGDSCGETINQP